MNRKFFSYHYVICFLLVLILIINTNSYEYLLGENGVLEITQTLLITLGILLNIHYRKLFFRKFSKWTVYLKSFSLLLILYEELSIVTTDLFGFLSYYNHQSELNIHNANILKEPIFSFVLLNNDTLNIIPITLITSGLLLLIGFGSYFKFLNRFSFLFLEQKFSLYILVYHLNMVFSYMLRPFFALQNGFLIDQEFIELFLYLIIILDTFEKIKFIKSNKI